MKNSNEHWAIQVNDECVSPLEILRIAKWRNPSRLVDEIAGTILIRAAAAARDIDVSTDELQAVADRFRTERELFDSKSTEEWLAAHLLTQREWEASLEFDLLKIKLREAVTAENVEKHFAQQRLMFDTAIISRIVVSNHSVARELRAQVVEDGASFHDLARQHSIDATTRQAGGFVGAVRRSTLTASLEAAVFGAQPGQIIGPMKTERGWELIHVEELVPATLDDLTRDFIKTTLFDDWLSSQMKRAEVKSSLS